MNIGCLSNDDDEGRERTYYNFFAFISVNSLKMANIRWTSLRSLRDRFQVRISEEIESVPVFTSSKQRRKRKFFTVQLFVQVVKKSTLDVQNLLSFLLLIGLIAVAVIAAFVVAPRIDLCKPLGIRTQF